MLSEFWQLAGIVGILSLCVVPLGYALTLIRSAVFRSGVTVFAAFLAVSGLFDLMYAGDKPEPPPPVIVVKDIEIKSYRCDHTGCEITWACGTNVAVGVDKFVIQRSTRQIPARTGWSAFRDYGETMTTNWATATPQHVSDVRWKIVVRKEAN